MFAYNFNKPIFDLSDEPVTREAAGLQLKDPDNAALVKAHKEAQVTLADLAHHCLLNSVELEDPDPRTGARKVKKESMEEMYERFHVVEKIKRRGKDGIVELTTDDITLLKYWVHVAYYVEILGIVYSILENDAIPPATDDDAEED
jgi:hypothetical protein